MITRAVSGRPVRPPPLAGAPTSTPARLLVRPTSTRRSSACRGSSAFLQRSERPRLRPVRASAPGGRGVSAKAADEVSANPGRISSWELSEDGASEGLVELLVCGLSVSPSGFVCLMGPELCSVADPSTSLEAVLQEDCRVLPVQVTSGGRDRINAESIEALTLLQLVQGIDVGVRLPYEALSQACPGILDGSMLQEVILQEVPVLSPEDKEAPGGDEGNIIPHGFSALLFVDGDAFECESPFDALALALRYKAPVLVPAELLQGRSLAAPEARGQFPDALPVEESTKQAQSITSNICVAWRTAATPIGDDDIMQLREQLGSGRSSGSSSSSGGSS